MQDSQLLTQSSSQVCAVPPHAIMQEAPIGPLWHCSLQLDSASLQAL
jgi:hypothetical protein